MNPQNVLFTVGAFFIPFSTLTTGDNTLHVLPVGFSDGSFDEKFNRSVMLGCLASFGSPFCLSNSLRCFHSSFPTSAVIHCGLSFVFVIVVGTYLCIASSSDVNDFSSSTGVSSDVSAQNVSIFLFHVDLQSLPIRSSVEMGFSWFLGLPDGGDVKFCIHCMVAIF